MSGESPLGGSNRIKILGGVLAVLLLALSWTNLRPLIFPPKAAVSTSDGHQGPPSRNRRRSRNAGRAGIPEEIRELNLAALDPSAQSYEIGRNLWEYYVPPPPPPPPRPQPVARPPQIVQDTRPVTPPPPPPPTPPRINFNFLGTLGPKHRRIAVFSEGDEIINALEGDVIQKQFRVAKIGFESVTIEYVDFPDAKPAQMAVGG